MMAMREYKCRRCSGIFQRARQARYCEPCWAEVVASNIRAHSKCGACDGSSRKCVACATILRGIRSAAAIRSTQTRRKIDPNWGAPAGADTRWRAAAHAAVKKAIARGELASLKDGKTKCEDCQEPARQYDHRDYGQPLLVVPVCISCNNRRGTAKYPATAYEPKTMRKAARRKA